MGDSGISIIGVDPGLAVTGYGLVKGRGSTIEEYRYGSIQTSKHTPLPTRLDEIFSGLSGIIGEDAPDFMVVEDVFSLDRYPKSGITLGKVAGVVILAGCRAEIPVFEIPVREAKRILTGNGNAGKAQLEMAVRRALNSNVPIKPNHASDALGLAMIGFFRKDRLLTDGKRAGRPQPGMRTHPSRAKTTRFGEGS